MVEEIRFGADLVRTLLREQHPDLAGLELRDVDGGWGNQLFRLGDDLAVRLPRIGRAPEQLAHEQRWVPILAERLPLPVPVPVRVGVPSELFPHPWSVVRWVQGEPGDRTPLTDPADADVLAGFLVALHRPAPRDAPGNPDRDRPLTELPVDLDAWSRLVGQHVDTDRLREVWQDALAAPLWDRPAVWIHADLHPANVTVIDGSLAGIIDFGDMCAGDPATDLAAAWILLPDGAQQRVFDAYGNHVEVDEALLTRARGWALMRAVGLVMIGRNGRLGRPGGKPTWEPAGYAALDRVLGSQ